MASAPPRTAAEEWRTHWGLVFSGMIGMGFVAIPAATLGLFMEPLEREFGWDRASISLGLTVLALTAAPLSPFAGALADRFGSRQMIVPGLALNALAFAAFALLTPLYWQYLATWLVFAFALLLIRTPVWTRAASSAFTASRGLAIALMMVGMPIAQVFAPLIANQVIGAYGWRTAYAALALGWGGVACLLALLLFHEPAAPAGTDGRTAAASGLSFGAALRDRRLQRLVVAILVQTAIVAAVTVHLFPLLTEAGLSRSEAAVIVATMGVAAVSGQLATGWLADRVTGTLLPVACFLLPALAYTLLLNHDGTRWLLVTGVVLVGVSGSACMTITTYLTSRYGEVAHFGKVFGLMAAGMAIGGGIGPLLAGWIHDRTGSYDGFLLLGVALAAVAGLAVFRLGPYPRFDSDAAKAAGLA